MTSFIDQIRQTRATQADARVVRTNDLNVGDQITEINTPNGPWYPVIKINPKSFVVDAAPAMGYEGEVVPVRFAKGAHVLVRNA